AKAAGATKAPEPAKAADASKTGEPAKAAEAVKAAEPAKAAPKAAPKAVKSPPPPPETSLIDEILDNPLALYGGGGFLLLLFAGYGYYAWRRKKTLQTIESSVKGGPPSLGTASVFGAAGGAKIDMRPTEIQSNFAHGAAATAAGIEEVDPIAEADVYLAYGRNAQAEEILKEALAKESSRHAIRGKLLEIYAARKDAKAFEAAATELHSATGGAGAEWEKAVALGLQIDPGNALYGGTAEAAQAHAHTTTQVLSGAGVAAAAAAAAAETAPDTGAPAAAAPELDFDLDMGGGEKKAVAGADDTVILDTTRGTPEAAAAVDFDFELPVGQQAAGSAEPQAGGQASAATIEAPAAAAQGGGIDFDFNLDLPGQKEDAPAGPLDLTSINLDLGSPGGAAAPTDAHWQAVATKLDLAKAYQEMGDKEGARELLKEVLKEGDAAQQQQAQTMLSALG
ncbi:MAG: FimV/HubP family polar landmark protein, partial [Acidobacteriota bacterium]